MIVKYSKSYNNISSLKKNFTEENKLLLKKSQKWNSIYAKQIKRHLCKNCGSKKIINFIEVQKINFSICKRCGHFNGKYQDTAKYNKSIYSLDKKKNFYKFYSKDYSKRVKNIYKPKLDFILSILKKTTILDLGCGAGHFLKACENKKIKSFGYDVNPDMVKLGKTKLKKKNIDVFGYNEIYDYVKNNNYKTISILGALEHLEKPNLIFKNFKSSKSKYLYFSVPLLSLTVFLEGAFNNVFPRVLSGVHTHLYTKESLNYILKKYNLKIVGEWWFGTDMPDLFRSIISSSKIKNKNEFTRLANKYLGQHIDELQAILDEKKICGDVHLLIKK